jgi:anti-sigma factor RsiW
MNCKELSKLIPDLVDGNLAAEVRSEAEAALPGCPDCQRELEIARQVRAFLVQLQSENDQFQVPAGFEDRLLERVRRQGGNLDLLDLSSKAFGIWLLELINLIGGLLDPAYRPVKAQPSRT